MRYKIYAFLLLSVLFCLAGCSEFDKPPSEALYGWNLREQGSGYFDWGYTYSLPEELVSDEPWYANTSFISIEPQWGEWERWGYEAGDLNGAYTCIEYTQVREEDHSVNVSVPFMYLQHISRSQLQHKPEAVIMVKWHSYTQAEMEDYLLFANERACVYDLTPFFIDDWDSYWQKFCDEHREALTAEIIAEAENMHTILQAHRKDIIHPAGPPDSYYQQVTLAESSQPSPNNRHISAEEPVLFGYGDYIGFTAQIPQDLDNVCFPGRMAYEEVPGDWYIGGYDNEINDKLYGAKDILLCGDFPIFCWQTFYKSDLALPEARIQIGEQLYKPEELAVYQLNESAITILYDFTPLVLYDDWEAYLAESIKAKRITIEDAAWIDDLHHILDTHMNDLFRPCVKII